MAESNRDEWQVENLRLSVFLVDAINPTEIRPWESLFGNAPDELRIQQQQQLVTEEGPFLNGRLRVEARNNRFDWRFFPDPKNLPYELPVLGPYADLESRFRDLMLKWLPRGCYALFYCDPFSSEKPLTCRSYLSKEHWSIP